MVSGKAQCDFVRCLCHPWALPLMVMPIIPSLDVIFREYSAQSASVGACTNASWHVDWPVYVLDVLNEHHGEAGILSHRQGPGQIKTPSSTPTAWHWKAIC